MFRSIRFCSLHIFYGFVWSKELKRTIFLAWEPKNQGKYLNNDKRAFFKLFFLTRTHFKLAKYFFPEFFLSMTDAGYVCNESSRVVIGFFFDLSFFSHDAIQFCIIFLIWCTIFMCTVLFTWLIYRWIKFDCLNFEKNLFFSWWNKKKILNA